MQKDIILYKRNNGFLRFLGLLFAGISIFAVCIIIMESVYSNKTIELNDYIFPIIMIIVGVYINKFTGYTKQVLVSYNEKGFNKNNTEFIEWNHLKSWSIKTKEKQSNPSMRGLYPDMPYFAWSLTLGSTNINTLKLDLDDNRTILFSDEEIPDIAKFIRFLYNNHKSKLKKVDYKIKNNRT